MGYSRDEYTYEGGPQEWPVNFSLGFLSRADVRFYVIGELDGLGEQIYRPITWLSDGLIRIEDPIAINAEIVIERTVSKTELEVSLQNTGPVTRDTLSRGFTQLMMNIHELLDGRLDSFTGVLLDTVQGLRDQALAYRDTANQHRVDADAARAAAVVAQLAAQVSEGLVAAHKLAAESANTSATTAQGLAEAAKMAAEAAQAAAETARDGAAASAALSASDATATAADRVAAQASAAAAATSAARAENSAAAAELSAQEAATFEPSNFYTRAETDEKFNDLGNPIRIVAEHVLSDDTMFTTGSQNYSTYKVYLVPETVPDSRMIAEYNAYLSPYEGDNGDVGQDMYIWCSDGSGVLLTIDGQALRCSGTFLKTSNATSDNNALYGRWSSTLPELPQAAKIDLTPFGVEAMGWRIVCQHAENYNSIARTSQHRLHYREIENV